jgi:hypothetical protein
MGVDFMWLAWMEMRVGDSVGMQYLLWRWRYQNGSAGVLLARLLSKFPPRLRTQRMPLMMAMTLARRRLIGSHFSMPPLPKRLRTGTACERF